MPFYKLLMYGFSMFSMFFGSGNLVFPLKIGIDTATLWWAGFAGLFLTGIVLPFLGLIVVKLHRGNYSNFFAEGGTWARHFLPFIILSLLGSFGVIPRCIAVAHGGFEHLFPQLSLTTFGLVFSVASYVFCLKERWMIAILGKYLTPLLLGFLLIIIIMSFQHESGLANELTYARVNFEKGFLQGYETMDLFAAFFFSAVIFKQIENHFDKDGTEKEVMLTAFKASLVGATLLAVVYLSFVYMGAVFRSEAQNLSPEQILPTISFLILGEKAGLFLSMVILLSCLTTAVALNNIYARYLTGLLKLPKKFYPGILLVTTSISFAISGCDFRGISAFLAPVLEVTYPALIFLTVASLLTRRYRLQKQVIFYGLTAALILYKTLPGFFAWIRF